jgi:hypothetical protein
MLQNVGFDVGASGLQSGSRGVDHVRRSPAAPRLLLWVMVAGLAGCSSDDSTKAAPSTPVPAVQFAASLARLPTCNRPTDGEVWYVWSTSQFYVCRGSTSTWTATNLNGLNAAVRVTQLGPGAACATGGVTVQFGLDINRNGKLDDAEVTSSTDLCNGATGPTGATGPQGPQGARGQDGTSCNVLDNGNGSKTIVCEDGSTATVSDGVPGAPGTPGPAGPPGAPGATGATGATGAAGHNSLVSLTPEPPGVHCASGGVRIETGLDGNDNGVLDPGEVDAAQTQYVCNGSVPDPGCPSGETRCNGACVNLLSDYANCGSCGSACPAGFRCSEGQCQACVTPPEMSAPLISMTYNFPRSAALGDLNHDGKPDLAIVDSTNLIVTVLLGVGDGTFVAQSPHHLGDSSSSIALGDLNADGNLDLVAANLNSGTVGAFLGMGDGSFAARETRQAVGSRPYSIALGDLNGDGKPDVVTANNGSNDVSVLLGLADGTFAAQTTYTVGSEPMAVALGDVNGDGKLDLVTVNSGSNDVSILLGLGDGTFLAQTRYPVGSYPMSVALGDLNGDDNLDIVTANGNNSAVGVLLGLGDGTFAAQAEYSTDPWPWWVALGDLNGDGVTDVVTANSYTMASTALWGVGNGTLSLPTRYPIYSVVVWVAAADLNGDAKLDLVGLTDSGTVGVLLNQGSSCRLP